MKIEKSALRFKTEKKVNNKKEKKLTTTPAPRFTDTHLDCLSHLDFFARKLTSFALCCYLIGLFNRPQATRKGMLFGCEQPFL